MRILAVLLIWISTVLPATAQSSIFDLDNRLVQFALSQISSPGSFEITADLVEDAEGATRLNGVKISDGTGVWMTIDQLVVDWSPTAILRGQLNLSRIIVRGLDMTRAPSANAQAPELDVQATQGTPSPFDWPRAPIPVIVEAMTLENIRIGPDVMGQTLTFDGQGSARDQGDEQTLEMTISRTDEIEGEIALTYLRDFAAETLGIDLTAREEAGGIVALLAGFPQDSASAVTVSGNGPRDNWQLAFDAETDEVFAAQGEATVSYIEPLGVTADFTLVPGPQISPTVRAVTGERAQLDVAIVQGEDRVLRIDALQLDSPALQLTGRGSFDMDTRTSDLAIVLDGQRELSDLVEGLSFEKFGFDGQISGPPEDLTAQGMASLSDFRSALVDAQQVSLTVDARRLGERLRVTADGTGTGLRLDEVDADTVGEATLRVDVVQDGDQITLNTARLDSPLISFSAQGTADSSFNNADMSVDLSADSVSQIARAYGQQATGGLTMSGTVQRVDGVLDGQISGRVVDFRSPSADLAALDMTVYLGQLGDDINIALDSTATGLRLDQLEAGLIGPARIEGQATLGAELLQLNSLTLRSTPLDIAASGSREVETGLTRFELRASTGEAEPFAMAYGVDASGRLQLLAEGTMTDGVLSSTLNADFMQPRFADQASAEKLTLTASLIGNTEIGYTVRSAVEAQDLATADVPANIIGPVRITSEAQFLDNVLDVQQLDISSNAVNMTGAAQYVLDTGDATARLDAEVPRLSALADAFGQSAAGAITLSAQATRTDGVVQAELQTRLDDGAYADLADIGQADIRIAIAGPLDDFALTADADITGLRVDKLTPDLLGPVTLNATAQITDNALATARAVLGSDVLNATLTPRDGGQVLDYALRSDDVAPLAAAYATQASGYLDAQGTVTLGDMTQIDGAVELRDLEVAQNILGTLALNHEVQLTEAINARIGLRGTGGLLSGTDIAARIAMQGDALTLRDLSGTLVGQQLAGQADVDLSTLLTQASLNLTGANLSALPVADLTGTGTGQITLSHDGTRQDAAIALTLNNAGSAGTVAGTTNLQANASDLLGTDPRLDADISIKNVDAGGAQISNAAMQAEGTFSDLAVTFSAQGETAGRRLDLNTATRVALNAGSTDITVNTLTAALGDAQIALSRPLDIVVAGSVVNADNIAIDLPGGGMLTGEVQMVDGGLVGALNAVAIDLGTVAQGADISALAGRLDAQATFDTRPARASATLDGTLIDFVGSDVLEEGLTVDAEFGATWNGRLVQANAHIEGGFDEPFEMSATIPVIASANSPIPQPAMNQPISATVRWAGEVRPLWAFVPAPGQILSGLATLDLDIDGTLAAPRVGGNVSLSDGRYENLDAGVILTELTLISDIDPSGNLAFILQGSDGGSGFLSGEVNLSTADGPLEVISEFTVEQAVLIRRDDLTAQISGTVGVNGPLTALDITGALNIDRAEVRLVNASATEIVTLGDVHILGQPVAEETSNAPTSINLNIDIRAANGLFVRGRGLESEWQLALDIRGTAAQPRVTGEIERLRGSFSLIGRSFDLTEGKFTLDGGATIDPRINVVLTRTDDDLTGQIIVSGTASNPSISFASQPALPEEEVLPQLLFGQSQQSLNAGQALQLASGLATLLSGNSGPFDVARGALGVDVFQLDAGEGGEGSSLTVGKTLGQGVFVGAETALDGSGENTVVIELDVIRNVVIDARIAAGEGSSSLGITYSRDF